MSIPIACRFVPYDQWLLTHLDPDEKVKHAKHWLLSKSNLLYSPPPIAPRSVSPITFAPSIRSRSSLDSLDDGYNEDDEYSDLDLLPPRTPAPAPAPPPPIKPPVSSSPIVEQYSLLSFSTGAILEDELPLSWYNLRPYELLELHPFRNIAPLQRDVLADYIQPFFQSRARVLHAVWNHKSSRFEPPVLDVLREHTSKSRDKTPKSLEKRRKTKADWKPRWVVVNQGILSLCKGHVTNPPLRQFPLSTISALRGADALDRAYSIVTEPRVVCIKFRSRTASLLGVASPPPSLPSSPISDHPKSSLQEPLDSPRQAFDLNAGEYVHVPSNACGDQGDWLVLDMLDDQAFSSILRILHRLAPQPISSSFVPSSSIISVSQSSVPSSPAPGPFASYDPIPYPEWRIHTVETARKAGMGDVGKPMAWVIWTEKGLGESLAGNIRHHRQAFSREMQYKVNALPYDRSRSDDESDEESEMEWEGWVRDLERQGRAKQRSDTGNKSAASRSAAHVPGRSSSVLPSPPLSEASPTGSPRARSPSLSHTPFPNIGNVIQANTERPYRSTVSVGMVPFSRRRSSTLTTDMDMGIQFTGMPLHGARLNARTVSTSAGLPCPPRTVVRHVHSSSNLRVSSYGCDAPESAAGAHQGPSSPSKRQSAFMRGMTLRAGKIVRGLESAIDFVDEKTA